MPSRETLAAVAQRIKEWLAAYGRENAASFLLHEAMLELERAAGAQADARPVAWQVHPFDYGIGSKGVYARTDHEVTVEAWRRKGWDVQALYIHPNASAPRLSDEEILSVGSALESARAFIKNGVDLGYIRMPDADCPDPAHGTLPLIERAMSILASATAPTQQQEGSQ